MRKTNYCIHQQIRPKERRFDLMDEQNFNGYSIKFPIGMGDFKEFITLGTKHKLI
jgi:hypothetical protein